MTVIAIVGPTASGKTSASLALVRTIRDGAVAGICDAEIINADAMQLYRGMDIGTAKVSAAERAEVPHHQLDVLDVAEEASVAAYQRAARRDIAAIQARGHAAIVVGGSGLYVRALLDDIEFPGTDPAIRARLEAELAEVGQADMHARLAAVDPASAERLAPTNTRRVVRALEVWELTGRPFSATMPQRRYYQPARQFGCMVDDVGERIARRTAHMWREGIVEETRALQGRWGRTARKATGYAQTAAYLAGEMSAVEAEAAITQATRQLARKQLKWFRADPRITWLDPRTEAIAPMLKVCS